TSSEHGVWQPAPSEVVTCAPEGSEARSTTPASDLETVSPGNRGRSAKPPGWLDCHAPHPASSTAQSADPKMCAARMSPPLRPRTCANDTRSAGWMQRSETRGWQE